jgi:hypothetical protein
MAGPVYTCLDTTCGKTVESRTETCPKCGGPMRHVRESGLRGWASLIAGLLLIGIMGSILWFMGPSLAQPGETTLEGSRFDGTADQAQAILWMFWAILALGVVSTAHGAVQIATGRIYRTFITLSLIALAAIIATVVIALQRLA